MFLNWAQLELIDALPCNGKSCTAIFNGQDPLHPSLGEFVKNGQPFRTSLKTVKMWYQSKSICSQLAASVPTPFDKISDDSHSGSLSL